jgi:hypothetical protein
MKFAWRKNLPDLAAWNSGQIEEVDLDEYRQMHDAEVWGNEFDTQEDEFILET